MITLEKSLCVDRFVIDDLCKKWSHELESLNAKSTFAPYIDPFLISPSLERHDISLVDSTLNVGVTSLHAKMTRFIFVSNFKFHEYVNENNRTKRSEIIDCFRTWCLLCLHCKVVKPFKGIGVFYGRFVKDFCTHMSLVDGVVIIGIKLHCSHICGLVLKLLEELCKAYFDKDLRMLIMDLHHLHVQEVVLIIHVEHKDLLIHCAYAFDHFLKLLEQWNEIHFDEFGLLVDTPCKLDVNCDEPILYFDQEFVNLWKGIPYLSKNDVLMIENDCSLHECENKIFVPMPLLITFLFAPYEDPFLCTYSYNESAKSFVAVLKDMGIGSVEMFEAKRVKLCETCVWHNTCFHCMTIKPFSGVGMFYCRFVKDFVSHGFVWDFNVRAYLYFCFLIGYVLVLSLLEHAHRLGVITSFRVVSGLNPYHRTLIFDLLSFHFIGVWNPDLRANPFQEGEDDMTTSARREPWIDWGPRVKEKTCQGPPNKAQGLTKEVRMRGSSDLRTNPFQEGEDDTIMEAVHQSLYMQLASIRILPIKMTSKSLETATIVFPFERASREYLTRPNRSPEEGVMAGLLKPRSAECPTRAGDFKPPK